MVPTPALDRVLLVVETHQPWPHGLHVRLGLWPCVRFCFALSRPLLTATTAVGEVAAAEQTSKLDREKAVALTAAGLGVGSGLVAVVRGIGGDALGFRPLFAFALVPLALLWTAGGSPVVPPEVPQGRRSLMVVVGAVAALAPVLFPFYLTWGLVPLAAAGLRGAARPVAVVVSALLAFAPRSRYAAYDGAAFGVMLAAKANKLAVPRDLSVIGFGTYALAAQLGRHDGNELVADRATKASFAPADRTGYHICLSLRDRGIFMRPLGDVLVLMPPLSSSILPGITRDSVIQPTSGHYARVTSEVGICDESANGSSYSAGRRGMTSIAWPGVTYSSVWSVPRCCATALACSASL